MKKSWFSKAQIVGILKEEKNGLPMAELCCKHVISCSTLYDWKAKYGGMECFHHEVIQIPGNKIVALKKCMQKNG